MKMHFLMTKMELFINLGTQPAPAKQQEHPSRERQKENTHTVAELSRGGEPSPQTSQHYFLHLPAIEWQFEPAKDSCKINEHSGICK